MPKSHSDEDLTFPSRDWTPAPDSESPAPGLFTLRQLLGRELPKASELGDTELIGILNALEVELIGQGVKVDFLDALPARVAYRGILQLLDTPIERGVSPYAITHLDGCDSACESCFQLAYCSVAREILGGEWSLAVEQAGINPSWSALFAAEEED